MREKTKKIKRDILLKYLSNPENEFLTREKLSTQVLGYRTGEAIYTCFTPDELTEIDKEALAMRRTKYASHLSTIDYALLRRAKEGDVQAIKLVFQRFEGWAERTKQEHSGADGGPIEVTVEYVSAKKTG